MTFGDHHPPLWLREHPNVPVPRKVTSSKGRRIILIGTPTAKKRKSGRSKKREGPSNDSPAKASKKWTAAATASGSKRVVIQEAVAQGPLPIEKNAAQKVSAPMSKRPVRKTRAGRKTYATPPSSSLQASAVACKSARDIVCSERRVTVSPISLLFVN